MCMTRSALIRLSDGIARCETAALVALVAAVCLLILLNVVTRSAGFALYWVDELAIYCMSWFIIIGASLMIHRRQSIAVTLLEEFLPRRVMRWLGLVIDVMVCSVNVFVLILCWRWFDLPGLAAAGFDLEEFSARTFNFVYDEPTTTIGVRKVVVWAVVPCAVATAALHAFSNFLSGLSPDPLAAAGRRGSGPP